MKTLTTLLALALFCATGYGQTIKSLGYNTTNGQIVAATNVAWTNSFGFSTNTVAAGVRTNLGLGATWLTNDNVTNFRTAIGLGATNDVSFRAVNTEEILVTTQIDFDTPTVASDTRANLGLPLPALTNTSNADMLSALGAAQTIFTVKTNDQTIIDETNATTITDLTFATEPGARYVVTFYPIIEGVTIVQMNETNATIYGQWNGLGTGFASATELTTGRTFSVSGSDTRGALQVFYVEGGTNAGSISATFRGADTNTTNTIKAGSFLRADKMP